MDVSKKYIVYIHICKINNKKYVGVTCQKPSQRWKNGGGYKRHRLFYEDIVKYGWDNFDHQIIASQLTKQEAYDLQVRVISQLNTTDQKYGYNFSMGGANSYLGKHLSEQAKQKNSQWHKQHPPASNVGQLGAEKIRKKIICVQTGQVFESIIQATISCGGSAKSRCINELVAGVNKYRHTAYGYHWKYFQQQESA